MSTPQPNASGDDGLGRRFWCLVPVTAVSAGIAAPIVTFAPLFVRLWRVETTFQGTRPHLGGETQRQWSAIADQVSVASGNGGRIARVVGKDRTDVVRCTVHIADADHWGEVDRAYAGSFGAHRPARPLGRAVRPTSGRRG